MIRALFSKQFLRFALVGAANTLMDLGVLNLLIFIFGVPTSATYPFYKLVSFLCALIQSFFLNVHFTFKPEEKHWSVYWKRFLGVSIAGLLINVLVPAGLMILLSRMTTWDARLLANLAALVGVGLSTLFNFFGYKIFVFKT